MKFEYWLRDMKTRFEFTVNDIHERSGIGKSTIRCHLKGEHFPREEVFYLYCKCFEIDESEWAKLYMTFYYSDDKLQRRWERG